MGGIVRQTSNSITRATLLGRLRSVPDDPAAWSEFVQRYGRKILAWCRAWGLQEADAQDVTQTVFLNLTTRLQTFSYDPNRCFRAWLKTVSRRAWQDYIEKTCKAGARQVQISWLEQLDGFEAQDDLARRVVDAYDEELLHEAAARIRLRIEPRTWDAFYLLAIEGLSGAEAAQRLKMKVATVYVARSKVQKMLTDEVLRLQAILEAQSHAAAV
jgi:RNA polymerase sigma-70 factor (ECF subfamily)